MTKRRGLGRGLSALIPDGDNQKEQNSGLKEVDVSAIVPNPHQPRSLMDSEQLDELAASIKEHGLIQPLIVTQSGPQSYTLIAGERRWRASQQAGLTVVPVVVKEATPLAMLELAIIENIQRADLNAVEEAVAYRQLIDEFGLTQQDVAQRMGKSRSAVANIVRLLTLPENIQQAVVDGEISEGHARCLVPLPTPEIQNTVLQTIIKKGLNVRQTEALVRKLMTAETPAPKLIKRISPELGDVRERFRQSLGTRVDIQPGPDGKGGKVVIHYYSDEDLQALYDNIVTEE